MTSRSITEPGRASLRTWLGLAVLALPTLLLAMDITVLYLAAPHLAASLRPTGTELLWIIDGYGFLIAGFLVVMGNLGDRIGRRRLLLIGATAFAVLSVAAAYAPTAEALIAARALLGIAGATLMPSTLALISSLFGDPAQRGMAIGIWAACLSGGVALGPLVGGALLESWWWGSVFLIAVPVMGLLLVTAPWVLPEHRDPAPGRIDLPSVGLSLAATLPAIYGIKMAVAGGEFLAGIVSIGAGIVFGVLFARRQRGLENPLIDLRLFGERRFRAAMIVMTAGIAVTAGVYLFVTNYLQQVVKLSPLQAGLWLLPSSGAMIVTSVLGPALARRFPAGRIVAVSLLVSAAGFAVLISSSATSGLPVVVLGIVIVYLGQGPIMALSTDLIVGSAPPRKAGAASALSETGTELGLALGVAILGSLGAALYRHQVGAHLPAGTAQVARESHPETAAVAAELPPSIGADLLRVADAATTSGLVSVAAIAAAVSAGLAVLAWRTG
ncbi:MFS transporter [Amycolatopsis sp. lyj-108]|uniref:MFS transporter n=1 Tax=Amycolatopsis sp. lyj-108 TaxID=2789286 RepID=UPI0039788BBA